MPVFVCRMVAALMAAGVMGVAPYAPAAPCPVSAVSAISVGTVATVAPGASRSFALKLAAGEGVIIDLVGLKPESAATASSEGSGDSARASAPPVRALSLCDSAGVVLAPLPGEVFAKGGSVTSTGEGERLRFLSAAAAQYVVAVSQSDEPRELLVRRREIGTSPAPVISAKLDTVQNGIASSAAPMVFSFAGAAGQWVQLKSTSDKDTLLRLAGPDRAGAYSVLAENDDSDGLNPAIRRKLPIAGIYYLQVDSLSEEPGDFELSLKRTEAPKPPPPPLVLRTGAPVAGRLTGSDDVRLYAIPVVSGHTYRLDLTAPYDGVVAIGLPNPVEPDDGGDKPDAGFAEIKSQDSGTTGTEKLSFTARSSGQLLVRVKSFGIGDSDGGYTLTASDLGS